MHFFASLSHALVVCSCVVVVWPVEYRSINIVTEYVPAEPVSGEVMGFPPAPGDATAGVAIAQLHQAMDTGPLHVGYHRLPPPGYRADDNQPCLDL